MAGPPRVRPPETPPAVLRIDTFADLTCPWCYLALRRLDAVLAEERLDGRFVARYWQPFLLHPALPEAGEAWDDFCTRAFGSRARAETVFRAVEVAGRADGVAFDFTRMRHAPSTRRAHRLVLAAGERAHALARRFFRAHFEEGADLSDAATLACLAAEQGVDARAVLASGAFEAELGEAQAAAASLGLTGVPAIVFNRRGAVSGAQPATVYRQALAHARS